MFKYFKYKSLFLCRCVHLFIESKYNTVYPVIQEDIYYFKGVYYRLLNPSNKPTKFMLGICVGFSFVFFSNVATYYIYRFDVIFQRQS